MSGTLDCLQPGVPEKAAQASFLGRQLIKRLEMHGVILQWVSSAEVAKQFEASV